MFESLYFKDVLDEEVGKCLAKRYAGTTVNDRSLGKMYYLKQFSKYADEMYNQLRGKIDSKGAVDKKIVANDGQFAAQASTRAGSVKLDKDKVHEEISLLLQAVAAAAGAELSAAQLHIQATLVLERCTVVGKEATVIQVVENASV
jgi:hypothetical protein